MTRQRNIVPIGHEDQADVDSFEGSAETAAPATREDWEIEEPAARESRAWIAPLVAGLLVAAWSALFVLGQREILTGGNATQWVDWIATWSIPVLLIMALWAVAMRASRSEASRFAETAALLRAEAQMLEQRLARVNGELSIAREFLTYQARDLESLGRVAAERIGASADRLETLIGDNGTRVETLHEVSGKALENMENLRGQIPVLTNATRDLTSSIGQAGNTADGQLARLAEGLNRVGEAGEASNLKVEAMRAGVDETLTEFQRRTERLGDIATSRFAALGTESAAFRERLDEQQREALSAMRVQVEALGDALDAARVRVEESETTGLERLRDRLDALDLGAQELERRLRDDEQGASQGWRARLHEIETEADALFERIDGSGREALDTTGARVKALSNEISRLHDDLVKRGEAMDAQLAERLARSEDASRDMADRLGARLGDLDTEIEERRQRYEAATGDLARHAERIAGQLGEYGERMDVASQQGREAEGRLSAGLAILSERLAESRDALDGTDRAVTDLTGNSVRLLELIEASARHSRELLPQAIGEVEGRLAGMDERVTAVRNLLDEAGEYGRRLESAVASSREKTRAAMTEIDALHDTMQARGADQAEQLIELREVLEKARADSEAMAASAEAALNGALTQLTEASRVAIGELESNSAGAIRSLASRVSAETGSAVEHSLLQNAEHAVARLNNVVTQATHAAQEAAAHLQERLEKVDELTAHLEHRIEEARARVEDDSDEAFARRVSHITEALNSTAIDIDKVLSAEVSDSAWQAYLRGERGIFTRRAVRLLDNGEARSVLDHYEADTEFREHVNRYIRDFEAMLRNLLSTRDGNSLSITLLSSDMGKLYVALAQAIERIRK